MSNDVKMTKYGTRPKTLPSYITGLLLSLLFTCASFWLVAEKVLSASATMTWIMLLALLQLFAQVICFLRLNVKKEGQWNSMPFAFTILIVLVLVLGSLWIMHNLNYNMVH